MKRKIYVDFVEKFTVTTASTRILLQFPEKSHFLTKYFNIN